MAQKTIASNEELKRGMICVSSHFAAKELSPGSAATKRLRCPVSGFCQMWESPNVAPDCEVGIREGLNQRSAARVAIDVDNSEPADVVGRRQRSPAAGQST